MDYYTITTAISTTLGLDRAIFEIDLEKEKLSHEDYTTQYYIPHTSNTYYLNSYSYKENIRERWSSITLLVPKSVLKDYIAVVEKHFIDNEIEFDFTDAIKGFYYSTQNLILLHCEENKGEDTYSVEIALEN